MTDTSYRKSIYREKAIDIVNFLNSKIDQKEGYPDEPTWGYAMSALLASMVGSNFDQFISSCISIEKNRDKTGFDYPWEFINYALLHIQNYESSDGKNSSQIQHILDPITNKGTRMTNWRLLRSVNNTLLEKKTWWTKTKLFAINTFYINSDGLILDELKTRSLQYHAFSLFLFCELHKELGWPWLADIIEKGVSYSLNFTSPDGMSLYIGRGQEQVFGYASLIYSIEYSLSYKIVPFQFAKEKLELILDYLLSHQRKDGSFPLVLNSTEAPDACIKDKPLGWYGYNTLYDYLPFLGVCFAKAHKLLSQ